MLDQGGGGERGAVPADADKSLGLPSLGRLCQIDDLRDVGEIVAGKGDDIRPPTVDQSKKSGVVLDLQVDQPDCMSAAPRRLGNELEAKGLEPQEYLRI